MHNFRFQGFIVLTNESIHINAPITLNFAPILKWYQNFRLLTNSTNPNPIPIGEGFGFVIFYGSLSIVGVKIQEK